MTEESHTLSIEINDYDHIIRTFKTVRQCRLRLQMLNNFK
jgi:hypothetical protein